MKKFLFLIAILLLAVFTGYAQSNTTRSSKVERNYTGKRFDAYGKPLAKKHQRKKKADVEDLGNGNYDKKAYPIGINKDKRKKKTNYKGKKRKKGCNCPTH